MTTRSLSLLQTFHAAFSFLTVLVKGKTYSDSTMRQSIYCYPAVGAVLFLLSSLAALLMLKLFDNTWLAAAVFLFSDCLLIRGLHHDGLADIADALGSGKTKEEFRTVLKDSRIGSFGVMALILYFLLGTILLEQILDINLKNGSLSAFIVQMLFVGFWSRLGLLALPFCSFLYQPKEKKFSLAAVMFCNFEKRFFLYWFVFLFFAVSVFFNASLIITAAALSAAAALPLYFLAKREDGYNGDFLGAVCLLWELAGFFALLFFFHK